MTIGAAAARLIPAAVLWVALAAPAGLAAQEARKTQEMPPPAAATVEAAAWLAGCWEVASPDGANVAEEQWMAPRGGLMVGMTRSVRGGEARGWELLTLRVEDERLVYHAVPSGQAATDFPARTVGKDRLEFVNAAHDFPRKIVYTRVDADRVDAAVFGEADADEPAFSLPYRRAPCPGS